MVFGTAHHDAPVAVDGDDTKHRRAKLAVAAALAADGADVGTVGIIQRLHRLNALPNRNQKLMRFSCRAMTNRTNSIKRFHKLQHLLRVDDE